MLHVFSPLGLAPLCCVVMTLQGNGDQVEHQPEQQRREHVGPPAAAEFAVTFDVMREPRPFCGPPKYSATNAVITASGAAIFSAVNRYGTALGTRALRITSNGEAAYERSSSRCVASTWRKPLATLTSTTK